VSAGGVRSLFARDRLRFGLAALLAATAVTFATFAAGVSRVLPLLLDRAVPTRAAIPLVLGLLALAIEVGVLIGWPVGWAEAALRSRERGEARARRALGESPLRRVVRLWPTALVLLGLAFAASTAWGRDARAPGRVARRLLAEAKAACLARTTEGVEHVPLVKAAWLCRPGRPPLLVGEAAGGMDYAARELFIADDLRSIEADETQILAPASVRVVATHTKVEGLAPFTAPSSVPALHRGLALAAAGLLSALVATWAAIARPRGPRAVTWALAAAGPAGALLALRACERHGWIGARLSVVPAAALLGVLVGLGVAAAARAAGDRVRYARSRR
jgi:hypothetical protein